jgi:hypothetical protein
MLLCCSVKLYELLWGFVLVELREAVKQHADDAKESSLIDDLPYPVQLGVLGVQCFYPTNSRLILAARLTATETQLVLGARVIHGLTIITHCLIIRLLSLEDNCDMQSIHHQTSNPRLSSASPSPTRPFQMASTTDPMANPARLWIWLRRRSKIGELRCEWNFLPGDTRHG